MALEKYKAIKFKPDSRERIELCNQIIEEYQEQGLKLTLRQLYYQLVSRDVIPNEEKSYKNLGTLVSDARIAGLMDWDAIEDRVRQPQSPLEFENLKARVDLALNNYRLPRWQGQEKYVELWVEKDALAGVLAPIASAYHVTLMVNRGYSSSSAMYESAKRFLEHCGEPNDHCLACTGTKDCGECAGEGKVERAYDEKMERCDACDGKGVCPDCDGKGYDENADCEYTRYPVLLYLGDHDPSGEDMVRDVRDRLTMFGVHGIEVTKLALNMDQVKKYKPPPNPAKMSDSRAAAYVEKFGDKSWEVDALRPEVLAQIIRTAIEEHLDTDKMNEVKAREDKDKKRLRKAVASITGEE